MKRKILVVIIVLVIIVLIILGILLKESNTDSNNIENLTNSVVDKNTIENLEEVKGATAYFTVESCVNKYITYVSMQDKDSVYKLLDNKYIQENNITENNVLEKIDNMNELAIFEADKMYVQEIDENNSKYYVSGLIKQEDIGNVEQKTVINDNYNIAVVLNFKDMIFSVIPLDDGGIFNEKNN